VERRVGEHNPEIGIAGGHAGGDSIGVAPGPIRRRRRTMGASGDRSSLFSRDDTSHNSLTNPR